MIGKPIFWQMPNDPKSVIGARVAGEPLIQHAPKSRVQQSIYGLAQALYGKPEGAARGPGQQERVGVLQQAIDQVATSRSQAIRWTLHDEQHGAAP